MSRLSYGALSVFVSVYDGSESLETYIGFFAPESVYDKEPYPSSIDLSNAPLLTFKVNATGIQDGPSAATLESVKLAMADELSINSSGLYSRLSWTKDIGTAYEMKVWFVSTSAVRAFNTRSPASNSSVMSSVSQAVLSSTNGIYNSTLLSSSISIDPMWLYLVFQLDSPSGAQVSRPSGAELDAIVEFLKLYWKLDAYDLYAAVKATSSGRFEVTIYFRTTAAQQLFMAQKLSKNVDVMDGVVGSLIGSATNDKYSATFLTGSPLPAEQVVINVEWPWLKFRLSPTPASTGYPNETAALNSVAQVGSAFCRLSPSDVLIVVTAVAAKKRASFPSGDFELMLYFTTPTGIAQFDQLYLPDNTTIINELNAIHQSTLLYNSTYVGSNRNSHAALTSQGVTLGWQAYVGIGAGGLFVIVLIIVGVVLYRKKFREIWNARKYAIKAPASMASMFSIKASQIELGQELGHGSFGTVYKGRYQNKAVAVKKLAANMIASQVSEFFSEASLMLGIAKHPNVVAVYGMCQELGNFRYLICNLVLDAS